MTEAIEKISILSLKDGDVLVFTIPAPIYVQKSFFDHLKSNFPNNRIVILPKDSTVSILREEQLKDFGLMKIPAENISTENPR